MDAIDEGSGSGPVTLRPIGRVVSELVDAATTPRQGDEGAPEAWIEVRDDLREAGAGRRPGGARRHPGAGHQPVLGPVERR